MISIREIIDRRTNYNKFCDGKHIRNDKDRLQYVDSLYETLEWTAMCQSAMITMIRKNMPENLQHIIDDADPDVRAMIEEEKSRAEYEKKQVENRLFVMKYLSEETAEEKQIRTGKPSLKRVIEKITPREEIRTSLIFTAIVFVVVFIGSLEFISAVLK